jgi:hypothetical protein
MHTTLNTRHRTKVRNIQRNLLGGSLQTAGFPPVHVHLHLHKCNCDPRVTVVELQYDLIPERLATKVRGAVDVPCMPKTSWHSLLEGTACFGVCCSSNSSLRHAVSTTVVARQQGSVSGDGGQLMPTCKLWPYGVVG